MSKKKNKVMKKSAKKSVKKDNKPSKGIVIAAVALLLAVATAVAIFLIKNNSNPEAPTTEPVVTVDSSGSKYTFAKYGNTKMPVEFVEILNQAEKDRAEMCEKYGVALELGDRNIPMPEFEMYYYDAFYMQMESVDYSIQQTGQNRTGYDTSVLPREQKHAREDYTWAESFTLDVIELMTDNYSVFDMAVEAGTEIDALSIEEVFEVGKLIDNRATKDKITPEEVMANTYCEGVTPAMFKAREIMVAYAQTYDNQKYMELYNGYSEAEVKSAFEKSENSYEVAKLRVYPIEGEYNEAEVSAVSNEKEFLEYAQKNYPGENYDAGFKTECGFITKETLSSVYGNEVGEWAFDKVRKNGDIAVVEGVLYRYLVYMDIPAFLSTSSNIMTFTVAYDANMTLDERAELYEKTEKKYLSWKTDDGTSEGFLNLSLNEGGAGEETVRLGNYYFMFENWIHDPARKAGDHTIIDSPEGICVVYYMGRNSDDYDWKDTVKNEMTLAELEGIIDSAQQRDYKVVRKPAVLEKAYDEGDKSIQRYWARKEEK